MKQVLKKTFKFGLIFCFSAIIALTLFLIAMFILPSKVKFDIDKIKHSNAIVNVYDCDNCLIKDNTSSCMNIKLDTLHMYTRDAFLSIEDKNFYTHNGLNYKRMVGAMLKNIVSFKLKEGASTISQQLIKNTHLTNEKTFSRKINEIKLTRELEKKLSKDEILEYYLNVIYFGDNCYGIESASMHYFSKPAKELTLSESATLAGMIKSPNTYSPTKNLDKTIKRRNVVLNEMLADSKISFEEYNQAKQSSIDLKVTNINFNNLNSYSSACIDEACQILNMPQKQIAIGEYKIYSYKKKQKQEKLKNSFEYFDNGENDYAGISISSDGKIEAYVAKSKLKLVNAKRQPGSTIKPILVYCPALNENIITPLTQINDEKIDINGYCPNNINGVYHGYVSVRDCVSKSLNIPAVKVLGYVGIDNAKNYAKKCGIKFDESDNHLGIALGGMAYGVTLKDLTGAYTTLCDGGEFIEPKFVNYITDSSGKIVYRNETKPKKVIRDDTAFLMTDMLVSCAKSGTGRKLGDLKFDVATKTGTVGKSFNTDAYNIAYTTQDIVGVWIGNVDNKPINTAGSGEPTDIVKNYLQNIYTLPPPCFEAPSSIYVEEIDNLSLKEEHIVYKANSFIPEKYIIKENFSRFNPPKEKSNKFISVPAPVLCGKVQDNKAVLCFDTYDYLIYEVYKNDGKNDILLSTISGKKGECKQIFDIDCRTKYFVLTKIKNYADNTEIISDKSNIIELVPQSKISGINKDNSKWYI